MARTRFKIPTARFYLNNVVEDNALIMLSFNSNGKRVRMSTGETIHPKDWSKEKSRAKSGKRGQRHLVDLNRRLEKWAAAVQDIYIENDYGRITPKEYKRELLFRTGIQERPDEKGATFFGFLDTYITEQKRRPGKTKGSWGKFEATREHLTNFEEETGTEITFETFDWEFRQQFEEWLYQPPREFSINNVSKIFGVLREVLKAAHRRKLHTNLVFTDKGWKVSEVKTRTKVRLTVDELEAIAEYDLSDNPRLERVRDLFLVGCWTGLRFIDWAQIGIENLQVMSNGYQAIELVTQKTKTPVVVPLIGPVDQILRKYDYQLPEISSQKFNKYIKEVCKLAIPDSTFVYIYSKAGQRKEERLPKWEKVSTHAARKSFATNGYEVIGSAARIMHILGHSTEKQFFDYIDFKPEESAQEVAEKYAAYFEWRAGQKKG